MLTSRCAVPAVKMPAGRQPGMFSAPRGRSPAAHGQNHGLGVQLEQAVRFVHGSDGFIRRQIQHHGVQLILDAQRCTCAMNRRAAYSGPVNSSLKVCSPKPLWMHWFRMPPNSLSRSKSKCPARRFCVAATAAARPAGPPPMMTKSTFFHCRSPLSKPSLFVPTMILESPPDFCDFTLGHAQLPRQYSMTRGLQNPAWHRPMPARVRRLTPSSCVRRACGGWRR